MCSLQPTPTTIAPHKIQLTRPAVRSASFSQVTLNKTDVGEFQGGYFVMTEASKENVLPLPTPPGPRTYDRYHKNSSAERSKSSNDMTRPPHQHSPHSPQKNRKHSPNTPLQFAVPVYVPVQAAKPNQAPRTNPSPHSVPAGSIDSHPSPPKGRTSPRGEKAPSPTSNDHWAGAAFSNAPPASSLPMPDFPPFVESPPSSSSSSPRLSPSSSPPPARPTAPQPAAVVYHETLYYAPVPVYAPLPVPVAPPFAYAPPAPTLDQLSMDLRRMLHIGVP